VVESSGLLNRSANRRQVQENSFKPLASQHLLGCLSSPDGVHGQVVFVAMRNIKSGEELTHNWATTDDDHYSLQ